MDKLFGSLKNLIKLGGVVNDNWVFRLHYKGTVAILIGFSLIVTSRQYIGDPIDCISRDDIPSNLLDTFCWIHATFSVVDAWEKNVGDEVPYPGVDKYTPGEKRVYHKYYQWVCFVLFLQAMLFYVPRFLWKVWEGGRIKSIILDLDCPILCDEKKRERRKLLIDYFVSHMHQHTIYVFEYLACEAMNFVNVIGQMYLMDKFLGGEFTTYGSKVLQFTEWDSSLRYDPMIRVFPRLTKCTFHRYGSSGDVQRHDAMCILPINIINEKIYIFLWFWFIILAILSGLVLGFRVVLFFWPKTRYTVLRSRAHLTNQDNLKEVLNHCRIGDWFLLDLLCKNMDSLNYRDFIAELAKRVDGRKGNDSIV